MSLAQAGATVAVSAQRADRLVDLVAKIRSLGGKALGLPGDMTVEAEAARAVNDTVAAFSRIDILINSAGVMEGGGIEGVDLNLYRRVIDTNLLATMYTCSAAMPYMLQQGKEDIVTISLLAGRKVGPLFNAYAASKHAVNAMTDGMRQELGGRNIRVTTLMPGATATEIGGNISDLVWRERIKSHVTREGAVAPSHIGDTVVFIVSLPRYVNIPDITVRPTGDTTS